MVPKDDGAALYVQNPLTGRFGRVGLIEDFAAKLSPVYGAVSLLVAHKSRDGWVAYFLTRNRKSVARQRQKVRIKYPDGEKHTMECVVFVEAAGCESGLINVQLHLCSTPLIESGRAS